MPDVIMRPLSATELLNVWDAGLQQSATRRALLLLAASCCEPMEAVAALSVGVRDRMLLTLREWIFGPRLATQVNCPACREAIEGSLASGQIRMTGRDLPPAPLVFQRGEFRLQFRLPDSADLEAVEGMGDVAQARQCLLERCVEPLEREVPVEVLDALVALMGELDAQADVRLGFECPACGHSWSAPFDIVNFLWTEIHAWARRQLHEVHVLASAYGWTEREIVSLSPLRRQAYLEMVSGE